MSNTEHPGYWGGSTVQNARIKRLSATTFKQLVSLYVDVPVQHQLTRREFFAQTVDDQNSSKDGAFICACSFGYDTEGHRSDADATQSVLAILDLDEGEFVKDFSENPETLSTHLYPYNFVAWRTAKSTTSEPRLKVMVDVSPCHPSNHRRIVAFVAKRLGLPSDFKGVIESRTISQPQYRPLIFRGDDSFPVIAQNVSGIPISLSDLLRSPMKNKRSPRDAPTLATQQRVTSSLASHIYLSSDSLLRMSANRCLPSTPTAPTNHGLRCLLH
jgi:hypothetical protein